jgi:hypothetical protein
LTGWFFFFLVAVEMDDRVFLTDTGVHVFTIAIAIIVSSISIIPVLSSTLGLRPPALPCP